MAQMMIDDDADRALAVLTFYAGSRRWAIGTDDLEDVELVLQDLICDLTHLGRRMELNTRQAIARGYRNAMFEHAHEEANADEYHVEDREEQ